MTADSISGAGSRPSISLVVITRNEEELIGQCLTSASFCDELIVVDSNSTDRTVEIAQGLGAKIFAQPFLGFVRQKQFAMDQAAGDWILLLDADEQATHDLAAEIARTIGTAVAADGYRIPRVLYHLGHYYTRPIYRDRPVRLFRRERGRSGGIEPHASVIVNGRVGRLTSPILHFSYRDIADHVGTINRLSSTGAEEMEPSLFDGTRMFTHAVWRFLNFYIVRGGFLDGGRGLYAAITASFYVFLKYAKAYERRLKTLHPR